MPSISCHLQPRCACALCPLLPRTPFRHLRLPEKLLPFCLHPFSKFFALRRSSCCENKNPTSMQHFCDCGLPFVLVKRKWTDDQPICSVFVLKYELWHPAVIRNRKKVAIQGVFLFLGTRDRLERHSGMNLGPVREQGGPGGAVGAFGRALGWSGSGAVLDGFGERACWSVSWSGPGPRCQ